VLIGADSTFCQAPGSYFGEGQVPAQDRIGSHDAGDVGEAPSAEGFAFHGQTASLIVGEANPLGTVRRTEDPVLLAQVRNDSLLLSIDPAREEKETEGERRRQRIHWRKLDAGARRFQAGLYGRS